MLNQLKKFNYATTGMLIRASLVLFYFGARIVYAYDKSVASILFIPFGVFLLADCFGYRKFGAIEISDKDIRYYRGIFQGAATILKEDVDFVSSGEGFLTLEMGK